VGKYFPRYGHYVLVGNIEGQLKLYDVIRDRALVRTYLGHWEGVRGLEFSQDGSSFLSCSYDSTLLHWDTETGQVRRAYRSKHVPLCVRLNPEGEGEFITGLSNKQIHQYDMRTAKVEMVYDEHLNGVNTLTFADHRHFISTSDDKKVFLWQFGVSTVIRHISEPEMHSITYGCMHPRGMYFLGQSSDNRCVVYEFKEGTLRSNKKKNFYGLLNSGYTCGVAFSNDGEYVAAGDERGRLYFYDWKTCRNYRTLEAHDSPTVAVEWHPADSNQVLTCGWEGTVKLWT
jgi:pre-mRNA-processing factor 17